MLFLLDVKNVWNMKCCRKEDFVDADFLLIMKMKRGEEDAFERFIRKYYEEILKYCRYHCFDLEYAKDLTQETFLRFFTNLPEYHYQGKTKNYLYTIAWNLCKYFYKMKKELPLEDDVLEWQSSAIENPLKQTEDIVLLEKALQELSEEFRDVIVLFYFQNMKLSEIAKILNLGLPLVKYRLKSAKKKLEQIIGEYPD